MHRFIPDTKAIPSLFRENWKSGLTVALISVPLSIAISIASGAGPIPGVITGIWGTMIASLFGSNNYNVIGAAGALTTVLFAATLAAPLGLGAAVLPLLAISTGIIILAIWALNADRLLYYVPSSVMYGFATGVAFLLAASQLFDATGLSKIKRTGTFLGDIRLLLGHTSEMILPTVIVFAVALAFILIWKRTMKSVPAVIPASVVGILFGVVNEWYLHFDVLSLSGKFGAISGQLATSVPWQSFTSLFSAHAALMWLISTSGTVALIAVLETLITAKIADKITRTQSSSRQELFGLALANIGSGAFGGLPATGVFIRTGANIKSGATHRTSAFITSAFTAVIALIAFPFFRFIPMAVIAAILVNTALGLIETEKMREFWHSERSGFFILMLVALVTVFHDAGTAVFLGAGAALLIFVDSVSHGRFDAVLTFADGSIEKIHDAKILHLPHRDIPTITYTIAGLLGYIDSARHAANFRHIGHTESVETVILRLRDLFAVDYEGQEMLADSIEDLAAHGKRVLVASMRPSIAKEFTQNDRLAILVPEHHRFAKTEDALTFVRK